MASREWLSRLRIKAPSFWTKGTIFTGTTTEGANATDTPPVTASTPFAVGSVSKSFTAIATLMVVQDPALIDTTANPGITSLNLDAPISTYLPPGISISLPDLPSPPPANADVFTLPRNWAELTTRELLLMSSGTPDTTGTTPWNEVIAGYTDKAGNAPLVFSPPGSQYFYSDDGYKVFGTTIEKLTNITYAQFVQQQTLSPLGMDQSTVLTDDNTAESVPGTAVGYNSYDSSNGTGTPTATDALFTGYSSFSGGAIVTTAQRSRHLSGSAPEPVECAARSVHVPLDVDSGITAQLQEPRQRCDARHGLGRCQ